MNGPRAWVYDARRHAWVSGPNDFAQREDSSSSWTPSWLSGVTTRDWTLVGSSGSQVSSDRSSWTRPSSTSRSKPARCGESSAIRGSST